MSGLLSRQPEVDLLLETIYLGDLHLQSISQLDDSSSASPDNLQARRVEDIEVIFQLGERNHSAHPQARHIDEKPKIPQVRNQRGVALGACRFEL